MEETNIKAMPRRHWLIAAASGTAAGMALPAAATLADAPSLGVPEYLKFPKDPDKLAPGQESSHTPYVTIEKTDRAKVAYGKTPEGDFFRVTVQARHESVSEHYINRLSLYVNGKLLISHDMNQAAIEEALPNAWSGFGPVTNCWPSRTATSMASGRER